MFVKLIKGCIDAIFVVWVHFYTDDFYGKQNYKMGPLLSTPSPHATPMLMLGYISEGIL